MIKKLRIYQAHVFAVVIFVFTTCTHEDFESPEPWQYPDGTTLTIEQLRNMFQGEPITFADDYYIHATVTMDDKTGNIYRSAYLEDHTGAINLRLVAPGAIYRGDSVRIYLKGTTLNSYQRMMQLDNVNADRNIIKIAVRKETTPISISIPAIKSGNYQSRLIMLENVQFIVADVGKTFADKEGLTTLNRTLEDCDGNRIIVRTSGYANFADSSLPEGNGSLVAVVSQFQNEHQLLIRQLDEIHLEGERCAIPGDHYNLLTIAELRQRFFDGNIMIPPNSRIEGVVISDREHNNHPGQNLYITDESGRGIAIRFSSFHDFYLGSKIRIVFAAPMPMGQFRGLLQIDNVPGGNAYDLGPGNLPQPTTLTIAAAAENLSAYESTLVRFENVTISGGNNFSGNRTFTDATGQMSLFTYNWASFANNPIPAGQTNITGILSVFDNPQLLIRNLHDISP